MSKNIITLTRQQLYDEVWKQSVAKVAGKYNLHYGRLISSLKQANIPYPSSGYWTRVEFGKDVSSEQAPLPGDGEALVELSLAGAVEIRKRKRHHNLIEKEISQNQAEEGQQSGGIEAAGAAGRDAASVSTVLHASDAILEFLTDDERAKVIEAVNGLEIKQNVYLHKSLTAYKKSIKEYHDFLKDNSHQARNRRYYDQRRAEEPPFINDNSEEGLSRIILILDVVFKTVEKLGGSVQPDLSVKIRQDIVHFKFAEAQDKMPHEITKQEAKELQEYKEAKRSGRYAREPRIRKYDYVYNGKLRIVFDDSSYIRDSVELKLEDRLDEILIRLYEISEAHRIDREKRKEQQRLYLEAKRREEELRERK